MMFGVPFWEIVVVIVLVVMVAAMTGMSSR